MARRRVIRWTAGIAGGLVLLLLLAAVLLPLLVPRDRLRSLAETQLRDRTGGEVSLGELSLQVLPRLQLVVGPSTLAVTGEGLAGTGLDPGPLVAADVAMERLAVDLALWPLLRKELEFGNVAVAAPRVTLVTAPAGTTGAANAAPREGAAAPRTRAAPAFGLYLASVAVRDGELVWREQGTGREVSVRGWQQDLAAPQLGVLATRLQRLGGQDPPADEVAGPVSLALETRVAEIALAGFGEAPLPPLVDLRLEASLEVPPAADRARFTVAELSLPGWRLAAAGDAGPRTVRLAELSLAGGDGTVAVAGSATFSTPPHSGPLQAELEGAIDLGGLLALAAPYLPPRSEGAPPLPEPAGRLALSLQADLAPLPALSDAAALQAAWQQGLEGRADLQITGGPVTVTVPDVADPLTLGTIALASDLSRAGGRTRFSLDGLQHPAVRGSASAEAVLPPASGPLVAMAELKVDLARLTALAAPYLPPRSADAPPLPQPDGTLDVLLDADLDRAPALTDSLAWARAWQEGLPGRAELRVEGGPISLAVAALGPPLELPRVSLRSDLSSAAGRTRLALRGVDHPVLRGDATLELVPAGEAGAVAASLVLPHLDLDALADLARQARAREQARAAASPAPGLRLGLVRAARAAGPAQAQTSAGAEVAPPVGELIPPDLAADLDATVAELVFLKTPYTDVSLAGTLRERVIEVPDLQARLATGRLRGRATVDYASDPSGRATWEAQVEQAPASALLEPYVPALAGLWRGSLSADVRGACDLADPEAILGSLTLEGDLSGSDGTIDLRQKLGGISKYLGRRQDLLRVVYSGVQQHIRIADGQAIIEGLRIDGRDTDWTGSGTVGLDGDLDLDLHVRLPAGYTPDLGDLSFVAEALRDEQGRIGLDFSLTGPAADPTVALDLDPQELMKSDALQDRLEDEVKKGLGGLLDRLKGR